MDDGAFGPRRRFGNCLNARAVAAASPTPQLVAAPETPLGRNGASPMDGWGRPREEKEERAVGRVLRLKCTPTPSSHPAATEEMTDRQGDILVFIRIK